MSIQTTSYYCLVSYFVPVIALVVSRPNPVFFPSLFPGPNGASDSPCRHHHHHYHLVSWCVRACVIVGLAPSVPFRSRPSFHKRLLLACFLLLLLPPTTAATDTYKARVVRALRPSPKCPAIPTISSTLIVRASILLHHLRRSGLNLKTTLLPLPLQQLITILRYRSIL